jgi:hypothetical protein
LDIPDIGEVVASRTLEWRDGTSQSQVKVLLGRPRPLPRSSDVCCPYQILGLGTERPKWAAGVDGLQAISLALGMIKADLEALQQELSGSFIWLGVGIGDFGLDCK